MADFSTGSNPYRYSHPRKTSGSLGAPGLIWNPIATLLIVTHRL
jgi:hypothetical protein